MLATAKRDQHLLLQYENAVLQSVHRSQIRLPSIFPQIHFLRPKAVELRNVIVLQRHGSVAAEDGIRGNDLFAHIGLALAEADSAEEVGIALLALVDGCVGTAARIFGNVDGNRVRL